LPGPRPRISFSPSTTLLRAGHPTRRIAQTLHEVSKAPIFTADPRFGKQFMHRAPDPTHGWAIHKPDFQRVIHFSSVSGNAPDTYRQLQVASWVG
ncbi:MAG TPA: hypothetical protein VMS21_08370, partial [Methylomirabilota bacterium]|nr:hypothetical protein [Methylomirabilota bacterium]